MANTKQSHNGQANGKVESKTEGQTGPRIENAERLSELVGEMDVVAYIEALHQQINEQIETMSGLQTRANELHNEVVFSNRLELDKRRELDIVRTELAKYYREESRDGQGTNPDSTQVDPGGS